MTVFETCSSAGLRTIWERRSPRTERLASDFVRRVPLQARRDVTVEVGRHRDTGVAEPFLHDLQMHPAGQGHAGVRVAQVVEANSGHAGPLDEGLEVA